MADTEEQVLKIVREHLNVDAERVKLNSNFIDDLGADSLDSVELIMACEAEFHIEIPDEAMESMETVSDLIKYVDKARA